MIVVVDQADPTPPYEQVRKQIAAAIGAGGFAVGDRLPSVRQLANDLGVAPGTVARAYRELESEGLIVSRRGGGTRVAAVPRSRDDVLAESAARLVAEARAAGFDDDAIRTAVDAALA